MSIQELKKRRFVRQHVELPVRFWTISRGPQPEYRKGQTIDISEGGLLMTSDSFDDDFVDDLVEDAARFALRIHVRGEEWLRAIGKVIWMEEVDGCWQLRLCFVDLDAQTMNNLREFLGTRDAD